MYYYIKAIHIIFIVTWFSGMFYIPRLFIYNTEAEEKPEPDKTILHKQFSKMMKGLWLGITWPSAILTLIFGVWMAILYGSLPQWLLIKLAFVTGLYAYHFTLQKIYTDQIRGVFKYTSQQLRVWNEIATVFLVAIVITVSVKQAMSPLWGLLGLVLFIIILMSAIKIYKIIRSKK
ncbi:MAG: CopD family protein [Bacteroidetes bacterium]|nr:CopD family protein [Bacteroidota bacterium]MBS1758084.1 CopD family protein [Bacteroidota bacterium]